MHWAVKGLASTMWGQVLKLATMLKLLKGGLCQGVEGFELGIKMAQKFLNSLAPGPQIYVVIKEKTWTMGSVGISRNR